MRWLTGILLIVALSCSGPIREVLTEPTDGCTPAETRCNGAVAEICSSDERWTPTMNCPEVGAAFVCCVVENGHTCLPECTL